MFFIILIKIVLSLVVTVLGLFALIFSVVEHKDFVEDMISYITFPQKKYTLEEKISLFKWHAGDFLKNSAYSVLGVVALYWGSTELYALIKTAAALK